MSLCLKPFEFCIALSLVPNKYSETFDVNELNDQARKFGTRYFSTHKGFQTIFNVCLKRKCRFQKLSRGLFAETNALFKYKYK